MHLPMQEALGACAEVWDPSYLDQDSERLLRQAVEARAAMLGPKHRETLQASYCLATALTAAGEYEEAEALYRSALAGLTATVGPGHPSTLAALNGLGVALREMKRYQDAEPVFRRALIGCCEAFGPAHAETLNSLRNLAVLLRATGRHSEADILCRQCPPIGEVEELAAQNVVSNVLVSSERQPTNTAELVVTL